MSIFDKLLIFDVLVAIIVAVVFIVKAKNKKNKKSSKKKKSLISLPEIVSHEDCPVDIKTGSKKEAEGVIFGKKKDKYYFSPTQAEGHISVFGGSGLGKTSSLLIPTLRNWKGHYFAVDISGDISSNVEHSDAILYDPTNASSNKYNVFGVIDQMETVSEKNEALQQLAFLLIPNKENAEDNVKFFNDNGRKIITASLIAFYHQGMDFIDICDMIVGNGYPQLFQAIDETENNDAIKFINSFEGANEKNTAGCKQTADDALTLFASNINVKQSIGRGDGTEETFTPLTLESKSVFVVIPDEKLKLYSPLLKLITAQTLEFMSQRSNDAKTKILLCLDEFASLGKLEMLDGLRKLRKKKVRIMILTQSMADIDLIYGQDERKAMMNNFNFKVILSAGDTDTQEYFAKLIGQEEKLHKTYDGGGTLGTANSSSYQKEYIIEPSDLASLGDQLIVLTTDGYIRVDKNFYYLYDKDYKITK